MLGTVPSDDDDDDIDGDDDDDDDDNGASSDDSDASSSSESEKADACSTKDDDGTVFEKSSMFRPSKSPRRTANTPSPSTRRRSRAEKDDQDDAESQSTPCAASKNKGTLQDITLVPPQPSAAPQHWSAPSSACSRAHGWRPINKQRRTAQSLSLTPHAEHQPVRSDMRNIPTAPAAMQPSRVVYVGNIVYTVTRQELIDLFSKSGRLVMFRTRSEMKAHHEELEQDVHRRIAEQRSEHQLFEKGFEERIATVRREDRGARARHDDVTAQHVAALRDEFKAAKEKLEKQVGGQGGAISVPQTRVQTQSKEAAKLQQKLDGQELRVQILYKQVDGLVARNRDADGKSEPIASKL